MKKLLILIFIFSLQNSFSQNIKSDSKTAKIIDNKIYNTADVEFKPEFPGGNEKLYKFINNNILHPDENLNVKGNVNATFIIEKDGTLTNIKILKDIGYGTGAEVLRVLKKCPKWTPGTNNHRLVRVLYSAAIPIRAPID